MKKKLFGILLMLLILICGFVFSLVYKTTSQLDKIDTTPVDVQKVKDGTYRGKSETELVKVDLEVVLSHGKIDDIKIIRHDCGRGQEAEAILDRIIEKNDIEVDAISGATLSSELIKDAVRKALR